MQSEPGLALPRGSGAGALAGVPGPGRPSHEAVVAFGFAQAQGWSPAWLLFDGDTSITADPLPDLPVMLTTKLQLELLLQEPVRDLCAISAIILDDVGATLQILRLVGEEYGSEEERPSRIEDCIASLETERWFGAVCACTEVCDSGTLGAWQHARRIGCYVEELAAQMPGVLPGEGRLIGLLHEIGSLPELLGWQGASSGMDSEALAALLTEHWHLPPCVLWSDGEAGAGSARAGKQADSLRTRCSKWEDLVAQAHRRAEQEDAWMLGGLAS